MHHSNQFREQPPISRRYRIAFCITDLDAGGAERQLVRLATGLDRSVFEPEVICLSREGALAATLRSQNVPVTCLNAAGGWDARVALRLWSHLRRTKPDLVQTFLFHANVAGRVAARLAGVHCVVSGIRVAERQKTWHLWLDRWTDCLVNRHVCVSRDVAEFSRTSGKLPAKKLIVIPNAVDFASFERATAADFSEFGFSSDDQVIVFVGRLVEQKDPLRLLHAFRLVSGESPKAKLLFVGTGPLEQVLRGEAVDLGAKVAFAGRRDDVPALLKGASCLALPSRWEGMPNVVLEAMAAGCTVVAAAAEGVTELLGSGKFGTIVHEPGDAAFAAGLLQVLGNRETARHQAVLAQAHILQQHLVCQMVQAYQGAYLGLLAKTGGPRAVATAGASHDASEKKPENLQSQ